LGGTSPTHTKIKEKEMNKKKRQGSKAVKKVFSKHSTFYRCFEHLRIEHFIILMGGGAGNQIQSLSMLSW
jgi:hypothetical protein